MQTKNRTNKCSSISIFALILELVQMVQILSVFSVKLTSALEIIAKSIGVRVGGGEGGGGVKVVAMFILYFEDLHQYVLF